MKFRLSLKLKIILLTLAILASGSLAKSSRAATYYIDFDNGNDTNAGTIDSPWKTIPGTANSCTGGSCDPATIGWKSTCYGSGCPGSPTISQSTKVQPGTVFKLKTGTTYDATKGGIIEMWAGSGWYAVASAGTPILFQRDTTQGWGTGSTVTFDGTGMGFYSGGEFLAEALISIRQNGIQFDGVTSHGITFQNMEVGVIKVKDNGVTNSQDFSLKYAYGYNNGTALDTGVGAGVGVFYMQAADNVVIDHVDIVGNGQNTNGIFFGDTGPDYAASGTVSNSEVSGLGLDLVNDDSGIGFKAINSRITFTNCKSHDNEKGMDLGQHRGTLPSLYIVDKAEAYNNRFGINLHNGYILNSLIYNNVERGTKSYGSVVQTDVLFILHTVYHNNGTQDSSDPEYNNFSHDNEGSYDSMYPGTLHAYNNVFYKPGGGTNAQVYYYAAAPDSYYGGWYSQLTWDVDYNAWVQRASESFINWGYFDVHQDCEYHPECLMACTDLCGKIFTYSDLNGTNGTWYTYYDYQGTTPPTDGTGHYHADSHSIKAFSKFVSDSTSTPNYRLTSSQPGLNLTTASWYATLPAAVKTALATDRAGRPRTTWDIGAYEYVPGGDNTPPAAPSGLTVN